VDLSEAIGHFSYFFPLCLQVPLLQPQLLRTSIHHVQLLLAAAETQFGNTAMEICAAVVAPTLLSLGPMAIHISQQQDRDAAAVDPEQMWWDLAGFLFMLLEPGARCGMLCRKFQSCGAGLNYSDVT
jgi:hypothetical protein